MKFRPAALVAGIVLATTAALHADSVRLKNGSVIEGKILAETPTTVTLEYGGAVKETKVISRTDIAAIDKETPDEAAFAEFQKLLPADDLLDAAGYDNLLNEDLRTFESRFKGSKHIGDVKKIIAALEGEKAKVVAGGVKIDGRWITGDEAKVDPYNHNARVAAARMTKAAAAFDYSSALSQFETIDEEYFYSLAYAKSLAAAKQILPKYDAALARLQRENGAIMKERAVNLKSMDADIRAKTEKAFDARMSAFNAKREANREKGRVWLAVSKWDAASLDEARETVAAETKRLAALDLSTHAQAAAMVAEIYKSRSRDDLASAATQAAVAKTNGASGPTIDALLERIAADVTAEEEAKIAAEEAEKAKKRAALAAAPAVPEKGDTTKDEKEQPPAEEAPKEEAASEGTPSDDEDDESEEDAAADGGGMSFTTLLLILAVAMALVTIFAKMFMKPTDDE